MEYDNNNKGVLFLNKNKKTDRHPDFTGKINVKGEEYWLSAWTRESQIGDFLAISISEKSEKKSNTSAADFLKKQTTKNNTVDNDDIIEDDIPF